jgi:hypothetical protein
MPRRPGGSVGLAGIEPATSPLSGLTAVAVFALVSESAARRRLLRSRARPAMAATWTTVGERKGASEGACPRAA